MAEFSKPEHAYMAGLVHGFLCSVGRDQVQGLKVEADEQDRTFRFTSPGGTSFRVTVGPDE